MIAVLVTVLVFGVFAGWAVYAIRDFGELAREAAHEERVDGLWDDEVAA